MTSTLAETSTAPARTVTPDSAAALAPDKVAQDQRSAAAPALANARLLVIQPALPEYRVGFFASLAEQWGGAGEVVVAHGTDVPGFPANDTRPGPYRRVEVPWQAKKIGRQYAWSGLRDLIASAAVIITPGDPHILVSHRLMLMRRLGGRVPVIGFGQFRGADAHWLPSLIKPWWQRGFDGMILYTHREAEAYLRCGHRPERLTWLDNGLARLPPPPSDNELRLRRRSGPFVCLGRHLGKNRFDLAVKGFAAYRQAGGRRRLLLIGNGPETAALKEVAQELGDAVEFAGAIFDPAELDARLRQSFAVVHPLAMGLSINTAFGYGLPVIACADPRRHMPEFWVWNQGQTGIGFAAPRGREAASVPGIAAALARCDALPEADYARMAAATHGAVAPLTTTAMATRVHGLCRAVLAGR
jgi:glycosyltransferase involved in cell wall biosynthesis